MIQSFYSRVRKGHATGMRAVILAGGRGVRLQPFTATFPKPLVPLGDTPVVEILIRRLQLFGVTDITLALGHLAELTRAYFYHRRPVLKGIHLRYVEEQKPTGTAGSLALIKDLNRTFLVLNGDLLTDLDFHALVSFHHKRKSLLTIATHRRHVKLDLGVLELDSKKRVRAYREKPEKFYDVSMGIYVYEPSILSFIKPGKHLDFPELASKLINAGERVYAYPTECLWLDVGRPDDYARAQKLFTNTSSDEISPCLNFA